MNKKNLQSLITTNEVEKLMLNIRGKNVLLDRDVAMLYGVETKHINQAVRNNPEKFPFGYIFELDKYETQLLTQNRDNFAVKIFDRKTEEAVKQVIIDPKKLGFNSKEDVAGDYKRMKSFATCARAVGMGFSALCIVVFEIFAAPVVSIFNGHLETVALGTDFLRILCLAVPLMIFNFQLSFTFQAMGMGKQSLILSSLRQGVVNIPLLFLMHHFFGLYGVVWTQLVSDSITSFISYAIYRRSCKKLFAEQNSRESVSEA